jgi:hypothetical protein
VKFEFAHADEALRDSRDFQLIGLDGEEVDINRIRENAIRGFNSLPPEFHLVGDYEKRIAFPTGDIFLLDRGSGRKIGLTQAIAIVEYEITRNDVPYEFYNYSDSGSGDEIGGIAIAKGNVSGKKVGFVLSSGSNGVSVSLMVEDEK